MLPNLPLPRIFPTTFCDASDAVGTTASTIKETVKSAVSLKETELARWKRVFDAHAKTEVDGQKWVFRRLIPGTIECFTDFELCLF